MYNIEIPARAELPTPRQLRRSSFVAVCVAVLLYVTAYLPAEYGIDPTGFGRLTSLTEMGEIKMQLLKEAHRGRHKSSSGVQPAAEPFFAAMGNVFATLFIGSANAHEAGHGKKVGKGPHDAMHGEGPTSKTGPSSSKAGRKDEMSLTLKPGQGAEIKLRMKQGAKANFSWIVMGGTANYDMHGDGPNGAEKSYKRGRSVKGDEGILRAAFSGQHGWFWRNRTRKPVTVKLWVHGDYSEIKRLL